MKGVKVGHFSNTAQGTGASVFLFEQEAVGSYWLCGSAPATHELAVLDPANSVTNCHGLVLAGGSAYGLHSSLGVMRYLTEKNIGHPVPGGVVPIVPASAIYDLNYLDRAYPGDDDVYNACLEASEENELSGSIGAGTGATVGKLVPGAHAMTSGIGRAFLATDTGLDVMAYVVVNAVGDVLNNGKIVAGACDDNGQFVDSKQYLISGKAERELFTHSNTTLAAVFTNAALSKDSARRVAKMATAGLGASISPVFSGYDGDIVFAFSVGQENVTDLTVGALASEAVQLAVLDAVKAARVIREK